MDETSSSSTNIRALRVRVRVTGALGLGLQAHTITWHTLLQHVITPMTSWPHPYDVMTPMTSFDRCFDMKIWLTGHMTFCCTLIGPFVPRDLNAAFWLVCTVVAPLTTLRRHISLFCTSDFIFYFASLLRIIELTCRETAGITSPITSTDITSAAGSPFLGLISMARPSGL